jgi:hypothetical protein
MYYIIAGLVFSIRTMNPPGRFLKQNESGNYSEVGDVKARQMVGDKFRNFQRISKVSGSKSSRNKPFLL